MKELIGGNLLINNIIFVDNVMWIGIWVPYWSGKEAKILGTYTFACIQKFIKIL